MFYNLLISLEPQKKLIMANILPLKGIKTAKANIIVYKIVYQLQPCQCNPKHNIYILQQPLIYLCTIQLLGSSLATNKPIA